MGEGGGSRGVTQTHLLASKHRLALPFVSGPLASLPLNITVQANLVVTTGLCVTFSIWGGGAISLAEAENMGVLQLCPLFTV